MHRSWISTALILLLTACGGGNSNDKQPTIDLTAPEDIPEDKGTIVPDLTTEELLPDLAQIPDLPDIPDVYVFDFGLKDVPEDYIDNSTKPKDIPPEEVSEPTMKVKDIQQSPDSLECAVAFATMLISIDMPLKNVVVTAPAYTYQVVGDKLDGFYVADKQGGAYSGIQVTYPTNQIPAIQPGMIISLVGNHKEAFCFSVFDITSLVVEQDSGTEPKAALTTPEEIMSDPEAYEGVLVRVENVTVTDDNPDESDGLDLHEFEVNGVLRVGNDYQVKYMNPATDGRTEGDLFQYIVGVLKFEKEKWHLMPRFNKDMLLEGETLPDEAPEPVEDTWVPEPEPDVYQPDVVTEGDYEIVEPLDVYEDIPVEPDLAPEDIPVEPDLSTPDLSALDVPAQADSIIVITEIMYDPETIPDDLGEWIEIYNASDEPVDLNGWRLTDEVGNLHIIQKGAPWIIEPGQLYVLGNNANEDTNGGVEIDYFYSKDEFTLQNKADSVIIQNLFGAPIDSVHYDEPQGWPVAKGASLALIHPNLDNEVPENWTVSTQAYGTGDNLGTPGFGTWLEK